MDSKHQSNKELQQKIIVKEKAMIGESVANGGEWEWGEVIACYGGFP